MSTKTIIFLKNLQAPVDFTDCPELVALLPEILIYWPFEFRDESSEALTAFFMARPHKSGFITASPYFDKPKYFPDAVNTICALVAELAWEQIRQDTSLLCVHAAAIEIDGRLLLIPNKRRAGKSTLTAALVARGYRVFTDDFLTLGTNAQNQLCGISSGITPRLRLPLPAKFGDKSFEFIDSHSGPSNKQYKYLKLDNTLLARKGDMLPIGGIMILNRDDENKLAMSVAEPAETLRALIKQNFAREMKSGGILRSLEFLVSHAQCCELSYANVDQTLELIEQTFGNWSNPVAVFDVADSDTDFSVADFENRRGNVVTFQPTDALQQSPGVTIRDMGSKQFLSDSDGLAIHQLNETSAVIWQLLDEPTSLQELGEIFHQAFPDNDSDKMSEDIRQTLKRMAKAGLVQHQKTGSHDG